MNIDAFLVSALNSMASSSPAASTSTIFLASWLPFIIVGIFAVYLLYTRGTRRYWNMAPLLLALAAGLVARVFITSPIRYLIPRDRPFLTLNLHPLFLIHASSFPSGHASFLFGFCTVVYGYHKKLGIVLFVLSTIACIARVAAGIHYPSDIIVGMVIGGVVGFLALKFLRPLLREVW